MSFIYLITAIALAMLISGGWRRLIPLVFGRRRRALGARMIYLINEAKFLVWLAVRGYGEPASEVQDARAAAITNFLFGESPLTDHESQFDMQNIDHEAMAWLAVNPNYCELVIQSLKIEGIAKECLGESGDQFNRIVGSPVFIRFGNKYSTLPDPQTYEALVNHMAATLAPDARAAVASRR